MAGEHPETQSARRVLQSALDEVETLRSGSLSPSAARGHILRVANAVDRALRRLLRDDPSIDLSLRLKALAPDELQIGGVLAELRRENRLSMELAASVHDLFETRRRLERDGAAESLDVSRAISVFQRLDELLAQGLAAPTLPSSERAMPAASIPEAGLLPEVSGPPLADVSSAPPSPTSRPGWRRLAIPVGAVVVLGAAITAALLMWGGAPSEMEAGLALFEQGEYAEAAHHFFLHAQDNPDDVTAHLYLARIHRRMNRPELAAEAIAAAHAIDPDDPAVHRELGFLLIERGQPEVAVDRFRMAIQIDGTATEGWVGLVRALRAAGRESEVEAAIQEAPAEARALLRGQN